MNITPHFSPVGKSRSWQMACKLTAQDAKSAVEQDTFVSTADSESYSQYRSRDFFTLGKELRAMALVQRTSH